MLKALAQTDERRPEIRSAVLAAAAAVVLALGAEAAVVLPCAYSSESASMSVGPTGTSEVQYESSCESMLEHHGAGVLLWFGIPVVLAALGLVSAALGKRIPQAILGGTIIFLAFVSTVLLFALFGMYYAPAGGALLVSAFVRDDPR
jgi:hypothetical protein